MLKVKPPLCFSREDAERLARAIEQAIAEYEARGTAATGKEKEKGT